MAPDLFGAARAVQSTLLEQGWEFCFIGGLAVQQWGRPRVTDDIDVTLLAGLGREERVIEALLDAFEPRIEDAAAFALQNRVLLLQTPDGFGIDLALGALDFEERVVRRARDVEVLPGVSLRLCTAEDLVVLKGFADRPLDWSDIESVARRQGAALDWDQVLRELSPLAELKGNPEVLDRLRRLRRD